jgi:hypothetical protein
MDFDPTELIRTLGSLASISSGYLNVKKAFVDSNRARRDSGGGLTGTLTPEETRSILQLPIRASGPSSPDTSALQIISPELLESATYRLKMAQDRLVRVIREGRISEIEDEEAITRREVCYFLSIILQHNGGQFPHASSLGRIWQQFRCTPLYPQFGIRST